MLSQRETVGVNHKANQRSKQQTMDFIKRQYHKGTGFLLVGTSRSLTETACLIADLDFSFKTSFLFAQFVFY